VVCITFKSSKHQCVVRVRCSILVFKLERANFGPEFLARRVRNFKLLKIGRKLSHHVSIANPGKQPPGNGARKSESANSRSHMEPWDQRCGRRNRRCYVDWWKGDWHRVREGLIGKSRLSKIWVSILLTMLQLSEQIMAEHLLSSQENDVQHREYASGFIIAPHNSSVVTSVHSRLVDRLCVPPATTTQWSAVQYLERVQVLQYFDFAGLTESVAEVSARLFDGRTSATSQKTVLYIEGLGTMIEGTQRRSGLVQSVALLSSLLRSLTHLSRTHPCLLTVVDLRFGNDPKGEDAIQSTFATATGSDMRMQPEGTLGRTIEAALDVLVLVHDARGTATTGSSIVEVVKDRVGGALGEWAVWRNK
jgi:hypothetical protein